MNKTLEYIQKKFNLDPGGQLPIRIKTSRRTGFLELFKELGFKVGAEIGVADGRYSKFLCSKIKGLKLFCIDPWKAYGDYVEQHDEAGQVILTTNFEEAKKRLAPFNCEFIRKYSMDAVKDFKDESLDFVFIDGNHSFHYVINDIAEWSKKVRSGGIVAGHDFWTSSEKMYSLAYVPTRDEEIRLCQVKDAVLGWTKANEIKPWFVVIGDKCPSWFWVK